jgi:glycolate oxidase
LKIEIINQLKEIVGAENVINNRTDLFCYTYDGSFSQEPTPLPGVVVLPDNTQEVSAIAKLAYQEEIPIIPRGAGTNLSGGTIPKGDCIIMQMTRMNRIVNIDQRNMIAVVEPGVINGKLQEELSPLGLFYPPDPASLNTSTIGGNIAEGAGGPRGVKYGVTKDYVLALEVVLADGTILKTGAITMKSVAGYDLTRLITGSEGTLAIVTQATLKLIPKPQSRQTVLVFFDVLDKTANTVVEIMARGIVPSALEIIDKTYIGYIEKYMAIGLPLDAEAMLLIDVDGPEVVLAEEVNEIIKICEAEGAISIRSAKEEKEIEKLWTARRGGFGALARYNATILAEDITVPRDKIPDAIRNSRAILEKYNLRSCVLAHAGDGNLHVNILTDEKNSEEIACVNKALPELFQAALDLGGTITGEHGVGLSKAAFLPMEAGVDGMHIMKGIKNVFDPKNILNPGKMFGDRSW